MRTKINTFPGLKSKDWSNRCRVLVAVIFPWLAGCVSVPPDDPVVALTAWGGPRSPVSVYEAWREAEAIAARHAGGYVLQGKGTSMLPLYGDNSIVVVITAKYEELGQGMTAIYMNSEGKIVGHVLMGKTEKGWEVYGLNNSARDPEHITKDNLIGVVYASFTSAPDSAARASKPSAIAQTKVALSK